MSGLKMEIKSLKSAFGMMCATTPDGSTLVSGGLDNTISVYAVSDTIFVCVPLYLLVELTPKRRIAFTGWRQP